MPEGRREADDFKKTEIQHGHHEESWMEREIKKDNPVPWFIDTARALICGDADANAGRDR